MKTIIAGSRNIGHIELVSAAVDASGFTITEVVSGAARGVDRLGEQWAQQNAVPVVQFPADWKRYRRGAGPVRNRQMAEYADALVAIWDGRSRGTRNMINLARQHSLQVYVHIVSPDAE